MAKRKYKQKPLFWYCTQYDGANAAEMVAFCPECVYNADSGKLFFRDTIPVHATDWVLQDMGGIFSLMVDSQFNAFFSLDTGGP
jgi:hypothetical protein